MTKRVRVKVNMPVLLKHLAREERKAVSAADVRRWLKEAGFTRAGAYWSVAESDLGHLQPSEVLEIETADE